MSVNADRILGRLSLQENTLIYGMFVKKNASRYLIGFFSLSFLFATGCKFFSNNRGEQLSSEKTPETLNSMDVNDVSFLYPAPPSGTDVRAWTGLPTPTGQIPFPAPFDPPEWAAKPDAPPDVESYQNRIIKPGTPLQAIYINPVGSLLRVEDLDQIIRSALAEANKFTDPNHPLYVRGSGTGFYPGLRWNAGWRVVSFRFEPCFGPVARGHGGSAKAEESAATNQFAALNDSRLISEMRADPRETWKEKFKFCRPLVRVVATNFQARSGSVVTNDVALHMIFELTSEKMFALVKDLAIVKKELPPDRQTNGRPLFVHPGFLYAKPVEPVSPDARYLMEEDPQTSEGHEALVANQDFARTLNGVLEKYVSWKSLTSASFFATNTAEGLVSVSLWSFMEFKFSFDDKTGERKVSIEKIPYVQSNMQASLSFKDSGKEMFKPEVRYPDRWDDTMSLADFALSKKTSYPLDKNLKEALNESYRLENPVLNNFRTADCVSCHTSSPLRLMVMGKLSPEERAYFDESGYPKAQGGDFGGVYVAPEGITTQYSHDRVADFYFSKQDSPNLSQFFQFGKKERFSIDNFQRSYIQRLFGYFSRYPVVNKRVINESAASAHFVNTFFLPALKDGKL